MRKLSKSEMNVLLKGALNGCLNLNDFPEYSTNIPEINYGECRKNDDGSISWSVKHLPIVRKSVWDAYLKGIKPNHFVMLTKEDKTKILQASITNTLDEADFPSIYPLKPKPYLADVVYCGFGRDEKDLPSIPDEWNGKFRGFVKPFGECCELFVMVHHDFDADGDERLGIPRHGDKPEVKAEVKPFDFSRGEAINLDDAFFFDVICLGFMCGMDKG